MVKIIEGRGQKLKLRAGGWGSGARTRPGGQETQIPSFVKRKIDSSLNHKSLNGFDVKIETFK